MEGSVTIRRTSALRNAFVLCLVSSMGGAWPALAHHAVTLFDASKTVTIEGTLQLTELGNPHTWFWVAAAADGREPVLWNLEGGSIRSSTLADLVRRSNLTIKQFFAPGQRVVVSFHPLRTGGIGGQLLGIRFADGRVYGEPPAAVSQDSPAAPAPGP
jgi:hypothetical protein